MAFSDNLQYLRKKNKMTQEDLAEELNVTRQSVSKWETGEAYPETDKLILLCDKFDVSMDNLVRGSVIDEDITGAAAADGTQNIATEQPYEPDDDQVGTKCTNLQLNENKTVRVLIATTVNVLILIVAATLFLVCGFVWDLWRIAWVAFLFGAGLCSGAHAILIMMANKNVEGKKMPKIKMALEHFNGFVMLTCTSVYLTVGMAINMWHPTWVIFIVGVAICFIFGVIFDVNSK